VSKLTRKQLAFLFATVYKDKKRAGGGKSGGTKAEAPKSAEELHQSLLKQEGAKELPRVTVRGYKKVGGPKDYASMDVLLVERLNSGVSRTFTVDLSDGEKIHKVVFKPAEARGHIQREVVIVSQNVDMELFAYELGTELGLPMPTVEPMNVQGDDGIVMQWVDEPPIAAVPNRDKRELKNWNDIQAFDFIIGNSDRHGFNILIDESKMVGIPIDHNGAGSDSISSYTRPEQMSPAFRRKLAGLVPSEVVESYVSCALAADKKMGEEEAREFGYTISDRLELLQRRLTEWKSTRRKKGR